MSTAQDHFFETALSLPPSARADLAFQLLQSLERPGEEINTDDFAAELRGRITAYRRGEIGSSSREETRAAVEQRLSEGSST
jgi:putative addiction module component (TIGR02574 family)